MVCYVSFQVTVILAVECPPEFPDFEQIFTRSLLQNNRRTESLLQLKNSFTQYDNCVCPDAIYKLSYFNNNRCKSSFHMDLICLLETTSPKITTPETTLAETTISESTVRKTTVVVTSEAHRPESTPGQQVYLETTVDDSEVESSSTVFRKNFTIQTVTSEIPERTTVSGRHPVIPTKGPNVYSITQNKSNDKWILYVAVGGVAFLLVVCIVGICCCM